MNIKLILIIMILFFPVYRVFDKNLDHLKQDFVVCLMALLFIEFGHDHRDDIQSLFKNRIFKWWIIDCDFWSLTHFGLFAYFGYLRPSQFWKYFVFGVLWEMIEDYLSSNKETKLVNCTSTNNKNHIWCNGMKDGYWYGKYDDIIFNSVGFLTGAYISTRIK